MSCLPEQRKRADAARGRATPARFQVTSASGQGQHLIPAKRWVKLRSGRAGELPAQGGSSTGMWAARPLLLRQPGGFEGFGAMSKDAISLDSAVREVVDVPGFGVRRDAACSKCGRQGHESEDAIQADRFYSLNREREIGSGVAQAAEEAPDAIGPLVRAAKKGRGQLDVVRAAGEVGATRSRSLTAVIARLTISRSPPTSPTPTTRLLRVPRYGFRNREPRWLYRRDK